MRDRPQGRGGVRLSKTRTARLIVAFWAGLTACVAEARAEEVYRWIDSRGVVNLTNVPADRHFEKYRVGSAGGSGKGILIIARRESARRRPFAFKSHYGPDAKNAADLDRLIARAARRHGLSPALVKAVVRAESNFQAHALSNKGAQGLMQLMPATAEDLGVEDPFRAEDNVYGGTRYLRAMHDRFGDWQLALAAYNAGPGAVDRFGGVPPYAETKAYVERVLHYYRRYDGDFSR
jgi:soluble lytic murein transglycosylase-like protein